MEECGLYPPRMKLEIATLPIAPEIINVTFRGTEKRDLSMSIMVPSSKGNNMYIPIVA